MKKRILCTLFTFCTLLLFAVPNGQAKEDSRSKVINVAKQYIGVPYKSAGTTPAGFDCSGYVSYVFNKVSMDLPRTSADQAKAGEPVNKADILPGDIVYFKQTPSSQVSHSGIYIGENKFISSTTSKGVKVDSLSDPYYWGSRYAGARRVIKADVSVSPSAVLDEQESDGEFKDVNTSYWAYTAIASLSDKGIISGFGGQFSPEKTIKRSEVAKMLSETFNLKASASNTIQFSDVPQSHWAYEYIAVTTENNYFSGYEGNQFKPDEPITRAEIAALFSRVFELKQSGQVVSFNDLSADHWAYQAIQKVTSNKIASGYSDQTYQSAKQITRAEFSSFLFRALQNQ